ncbi:YMGG-like glycine zipper-containing protein [Niabella drilacis]|uniref:YMGG-like Gly-zipper n=1 Tax=Niabella drilacis (strain DSM 25811 / CCM 8410 / CCUG 62505 / LMG 26954 / E90) TaxID=1285928 RepID=A0A1G6U603_NIADE|nr:YMGG-like glycine zipper-containing protein [Niabella drilacis]SDD36733.1 YMGG-like Gly-zipper [Niabella drilacis]
MMKKIIPFAVIAIMILAVACRNTKKEDSTGAIPVQDTLGLAEYQKWKMENEVRNRLQQEQQMENTAAPAAAARSSASSSRSSSRSSSSRGTTYRSGGGDGNYESGSSGTVAQAPAPQKRKGMSHTAKGAIVGAASGAIIGAVANRKNRLGGGVVGGVIGAATGAGVGAIVDKKQRQRDGY